MKNYCNPCQAGRLQQISVWIKGVREQLQAGDETSEIVSFARQIPLLIKLIFFFFTLFIGHIGKVQKSPAVTFTLFWGISQGHGSVWFCPLAVRWVGFLHWQFISEPSVPGYTSASMLPPVLASEVGGLSSLPLEDTSSSFVFSAVAVSLNTLVSTDSFSSFIFLKKTLVLYFLI